MVNALQKFRDHAAKSNVHCSATLRANQFRLIMEQKCKPIDQQLNALVDEQARKNQAKLFAIVVAFWTSKYFISFSVLAYEAADISNIEQMPLVIRFVDNQEKIRGEFMGLIPCSEGMKGKDKANAILWAVEGIGLDMNLCRGQGAGNMTVLATWQANALELLLGYASHILILLTLIVDRMCLIFCVAFACNIQVVRSMMGNVRVVTEFFNSSTTRFDILKKVISFLLRIATTPLMLAGQGG